MLDVAKSMLRLPWAVSLFGAQQLVNLAFTRSARASEGAFYSVTSAAQETFESQPFLVAGFQFGDAVQRAATDLFFDTVTGRAFRPEWVDRTADRIVRQSLAAARDLLPGDNLRFYIDSLRNAFAVINLVNNASSMLALPPGPIALPRALAKAYSFGEYAPLWLVEGLGEAYANQNWSDSSPSGLLARAAAGIPEHALLMMNAGMGLSFARHSIRSLTPVSANADVAAAVRRFLDLVRANSASGYEGAALESLGLVTRTWYEALVQPIDEALWVLDREALEYFWHGVGRATFFTALLPGANAFESVRAEARHELALLNGTAGCAWAFTLVNIKQPELLLHLISTQQRSLASARAFINGLMSTLLMANVTLPGNPYTAALCAYRPQCACSSLVQLWEEFVTNPCRIANEILPILKERRQLDQVFRYRDWDRLSRERKASN